MAILNSFLPTIVDAAKVSTGKDSVDTVIELLAAQNEWLWDALWLEANGKTKHTTTSRTGLPEVYWRLINQGIPPSKSTTVQVEEPCASLEAFSEVDVKLLRLYGERAANFRLTEDAAFLESMNQKITQTFFYGTAANPEEFVGLSVRYSTTTAQNGKNILLAGGTGSDLTSVWLVGWGPNAVHMIYPENSRAGFQARDLGEAISESGDKRLPVMRSHYTWDCGLVVRDWRYAVRIANVKVGDLIAQTGTQSLTAATNIIKLMTRAAARVRRAGCKPVFYAAPEVASQLMIMGLEKSAAALSVQAGLQQFGQTYDELRFLSIPIRICEGISLSEAAVS